MRMRLRNPLVLGAISTEVRPPREGTRVERTRFLRLSAYLLWPRFSSYSRLHCLKWLSEKTSSIRPPIAIQIKHYFPSNALTYPRGDLRLLYYGPFK